MEKMYIGDLDCPSGNFPHIAFGISGIKQFVLECIHETDMSDEDKAKAKLTVTEEDIINQLSNTERQHTYFLWISDDVSISMRKMGYNDMQEMEKYFKKRVWRAINYTPPETN
jgi:hypothetical protein